MSGTDFSIIIPVGRQDYIIKCLDSIDNASKNTTYSIEVILVGEKVDFKSKHLRRFKSFYVKRTHTSYRRNLGIKNSSGNILIFLDDDTFVPEDYFGRLDNIRISKHSIITGSTLPYSNNRRELITDILIGDYIGELRTAEKAVKDSETPFYNVYLCNVLVKRKVFEKIGLFNENIDFRMDDTEFFFRAKKMGITAFYSKDVIIYHKRRDFSKGFLRHIYIPFLYWDKHDKTSGNNDGYSRGQDGDYTYLYPSFCFLFYFFWKTT